MKVIFMGTPDFAVPTLQALADSKNYSVLEVVTQPDRPKGRGKHLAAPPVKELALKLGLPCYQPETMRSQEVLDHFRQLNPDVIVVVAYGRILPREILEIPKYGCINVHSSLLPDFRGAAPIHWAIYHGRKETGVTTMYINEGLDTGDMLLKSSRPIDDSISMGELHDLLKDDGAALLIQTLDQLEKGTAIRIPQDDSQATYAPLITKEDEKIDWTRSAEEIHNQIRAFNPWPGTYTSFRNERLKIWKTHVKTDDNTQGEAGTILYSEKEVGVFTGNGILVLEEVQPQSRNRIAALDWARGHELKANEKFEM